MKKTWKPILSLLLALCITVSTAAGAIAIGRERAIMPSQLAAEKCGRRSGGSGAGQHRGLGGFRPCKRRLPN